MVMLCEHLNSNNFREQNRSIVDLAVIYCDENIFVAKFVDVSWKKLLEIIRRIFSSGSSNIP